MWQSRLQKSMALSTVIDKYNTRKQEREKRIRTQLIESVTGVVHLDYNQGALDYLYKKVGLGTEYA